MSIPPIIDLPKPSDGPQGSMCVGFEAQLNVLIKILESARDAINFPLEILRKMLDDLVGLLESPLDAINDGLDNLSNAIDGAIPEFGEGVDAWLDMMAKCSILEEELSLESPNNLANGLFDEAKDLLNEAYLEQIELLESLAEFPVAAAIKSLNELLESLKVPESLEKLDGLLQCIDSICAPADISGKVDYINDLLNDMMIDQNGFLMDIQLMDEAGISAAQKANIQHIQENTDDIQDNATNSVLAGVESAKSAFKSIQTAPARIKDNIKSFFT